MPTLPLIISAAPGAPGPSVQSADDVLAVYPQEYKTPSHAVLDALNEFHSGCHISYQEASDYAAGQSDMLRATGSFLDGFGEDHSCQRGDGELDDDYRNRMLAWQEVVTPDAIVATVNDILSPYTTIESQYCESILDRWYVEDGSASWGSFVGDRNTVTVGPNYPDRLYYDDRASNDGDYRPQSDPGEALIFADDCGRMFFLRIPELNDANGPTAYATDGTDDPALQGLSDMFVEDGTASAGIEMTFASNDYQIADETYQAVINAVNRIKGQGVRWTLVVDPRLA